MEDATLATDISDHPPEPPLQSRRAVATLEARGVPPDATCLALTVAISATGDLDLELAAKLPDGTQQPMAQRRFPRLSL